MSKDNVICTSQNLDKNAIYYDLTTQFIYFVCDEPNFIKDGLKLNKYSEIIYAISKYYQKYLQIIK